MSSAWIIVIVTGLSIEKSWSQNGPKAIYPLYCVKFTLLNVGIKGIKKLKGSPDYTHLTLIHFIHKQIAFIVQWLNGILRYFYGIIRDFVFDILRSINKIHRFTLALRTCNYVLCGVWHSFHLVMTTHTKHINMCVCVRAFISTLIRCTCVY